jgi:hypothetical protein
MKSAICDRPTGGGFSLKTLFIATAMVAINTAVIAAFYFGRLI